MYRRKTLLTIEAKSNHSTPFPFPSIPVVLRAVLYAYAHYQHNALGTYPVRTHSERLIEQNPKLIDASDWVCCHALGAFGHDEMHYPYA